MQWIIWMWKNPIGMVIVWLRTNMLVLSNLGQEGDVVEDLNWLNWKIDSDVDLPLIPPFCIQKGDEEWGSISLGSWDPSVRGGKWWIFHQRVTCTGAGDTDRLDKLIRKAGSVIGCKLNTFEAVLKRKSPLSNPDHPLHHILDRKRKRLYFNILIYISAMILMHFFLSEMFTAVFIITQDIDLVIICGEIICK